ncbi:MAG: protein translocase subunit SecF [Candidatus Kerfeldbacteria bacterium]|nr:protein translocase subunit SecF [Candidatus Kerfeldbacteria bacterium]
MVRSETTEIKLYNILGTRYWWYAISTSLIIVSLVMYGLYGFRLGIDFTGGSLIQVHYQTSVPNPSTINEQLQPVNLGDTIIQPAGDNTMIIRSRFLNDDERQAVLAALGPDVVEDSFESVGPTVGEELQQKAIQAIVLVILAIVIYITWAFRSVAKGPVPSWAYGLSTIIALAHDVIITVGVFVVLGHWYGVELNAMFITALLTILGFSVHDTIVVFDRIREGLRRSAQRTFSGVINESINFTLMRSLNTSTTALIVLAVLFLFGGESTRWFVFALLIGIIVGTYSSIFIASPTLLLWQKFLRGKKGSI